LESPRKKPAAGEDGVRDGDGGRDCVIRVDHAVVAGRAAGELAVLHGQRDVADGGQVEHVLARRAELRRSRRPI